MRTLVLSPLEEEFLELVAALDRAGMTTRARPRGRLEAREAAGLGVILAVGGEGKAQFAVQTQYLLCIEEPPDVVVCAGVAGSLSDTVSIGDVVVATEVVEHDFLDRMDGYAPPPRFPCDERAIRQLRAVAAGRRDVRFGAVASGDQDVVDRAIVRSLRERTNAIAVAWEGAGGARACEFSDVPFIEIRGASDIADERAARDFDANLPRSMNAVAHLLVAWLREFA